MGYKIPVVAPPFGAGNWTQKGRQVAPASRYLQTAIAVDSVIQWLQLRCQWTRLSFLFKTQVVSPVVVAEKVVRWWI